MSSRLLICGATGFIGRNATEYFLKQGKYEIVATYHEKEPPAGLKKQKGISWRRVNLLKAEDVEKLVRKDDILIQAAATTSGSRDIVNRPHHHVTDNAMMNSLLFRACHEAGAKQVIFFSCSVMYPPSGRPLKEEDFTGEIHKNYFGVGWTKVYLEKMCEFYSRFETTRYSVIRHSNIYGPYDKYDLEKSHVFGATVAKVMTAPENGKVVVWGEGTEARDLLYVDDLMTLVNALVQKQSEPFELVNAGSGTATTIRDLVTKIIEISGKKLSVVYDKSKPSIPFRLALHSGRAKSRYGWMPKTSLEEGIRKSLAWYQKVYLAQTSA